MNDIALLEYIGIFAFAASGAIVAIEHGRRGRVGNRPPQPRHAAYR